MANTPYKTEFKRSLFAEIYSGGATGSSKFGDVLRKEHVADAFKLLDNNTTVTGRFKYLGFDFATADYCKQDVMLTTKSYVIKRRIKETLEREYKARKERERLVEERARAQIAAIKDVLECIDRGIRDYDNKDKADVR